MIKCKICDVGVLKKTNHYRMSGVVVTIGYILLIPSFLGMTISGIMFVFSLASSAVPDIGSSGLIVSGTSLLVFVFCLVGGLLGWLLVMKKKVLQCTNCEAVTPIE